MLHFTMCTVHCQHGWYTHVPSVVVAVAAAAEAAVRSCAFCIAFPVA